MTTNVVFESENGVNMCKMKIILICAVTLAWLSTSFSCGENRLNESESQTEAKVPANRNLVIAGQLTINGALAFGASIPIFRFMMDETDNHNIAITGISSGCGYVVLSSVAVYIIGKWAGYNGSFWKTLVYGCVLPVTTIAISYFPCGILVGIWTSPVFEILAYHLSNKSLTENDSVQLTQLKTIRFPNGRVETERIINLINVRF